MQNELAAAKLFEINPYNHEFGVELRIGLSLTGKLTNDQKYKLALNWWEEHFGKEPPQ
jgi:hypothetical protein